MTTEHPESDYRNSSTDAILGDLINDFAPRELSTEFLESAGFHTDAGNAICFANRYEHRLRWCEETGRWYFFNGTRWEPTSSDLVRRYAAKTAISFFANAEGLTGKDHKEAIDWGVYSCSSRGISAMLRESKALLVTLASDFDSNPWLLNCKNGTINLKEGQLEPHNRDDHITKLALVDFDAVATCPLWNSFLARIMPDTNRIAYLQRVLGMCLTGDITEQALFIFQGVGANGKSVLLDTVTALMGDYATESAPDLLVSLQGDRHPTEIADLMGRRLVVVGESEEDRRLRVNLIKRLTGDTRLKARFMRQDFFEFERTHKMILVTNNRPQVQEAAHAIWRRLRLVPFDVIIPDAEQDKHLIQKLHSEWPGILAWLVRGCSDWQRDGLQEPVAVIHATDEYRAEQDLLTYFLEASCEMAPDAFVSRFNIYVAYRNYVRDTKERYPVSNKALYKRLREYIGITDVVRKMNGRTIRGFKGVGLLNPQSARTHASNAANYRNRNNPT